jgi:hypothetical protein
MRTKKFLRIHHERTTMGVRKIRNYDEKKDSQPHSAILKYERKNIHPLQFDIVRTS